MGYSIFLFGMTYVLLMLASSYALAFLLSITETKQPE